ncbi:MAG: caspase family protein [Desulfovibrionales bacterium]|nr:caspase family protein [Desulfovibrionales bacterium]
MRKSIRIMVLIVIGISLVCGCTTGASRSRVQGSEHAMKTDNSPVPIGNLPIACNKKDAGLFSPDGSLLATYTKESIVVQRVADGRQMLRINDACKQITDVSFSPDNEKLVYTFYHTKRKLPFYQVVDVQSGKTLYQSRSAHGALSVPVFSADGSKLVFMRTTPRTCTCYVQSTATKKIIAAKNLQFQKGVYATFTSDSSKVVLVCSKDILLLDAASGIVEKKWAYPFPVRHLSIAFAVSPVSGKLIARHSKVGAEKHFLSSFDLQTGALHTVGLGKQNHAFEKMVVAPDGTLVVAWNLCKKIQEYTPEKLQLQKTWEHYGDFSQLLYVGEQKIFIGNVAYVRTPDALLAAAEAKLAQEAFAEAEAVLQCMTTQYDMASDAGHSVPKTLSCVEALLLQGKDESAQQAAALLRRYLPRVVAQAKPSPELLAAAETEFQKGRFGDASKLLDAIRSVYAVQSIVSQDGISQEVPSASVLLGTARAKTQYKSVAASIAAYVKAQEKAYVTLKEYVLPHPVKKPALPVALTLAQKKFETDERFARRVEQAKQTREALIQQRMTQYREEIAVYNNAVTHLEKRKRARMAELPARRPAIIAKALKKTLQGIHVEKPHFDRSSGMLSFDLVGNGAPYRIRIGTTVQDTAIAKKLFTAPKRAGWHAAFRATQDGFNLERVLCDVAESKLVFRKIDATSPVKDHAPASVRIASTTPDELNTLVAMQKQPTELADFQSDVTVLYNDGRTVKTIASAELDKEIQALSYAPMHPNTYLLAIGIENYKSAPNVPFAEHSLALISHLLGKQFGIPKENQIILPSVEATGQAIQGNMRNIAARLSPEDTLFFYYAGHGLANRNGKDVFMLPSDAVRGAYEDADFSLNNMIKKYFSTVGRAYVFLDTCFSGRANTQTMLTKGIAPVFKTSKYSLPANVTVFFAGQGDQYANFYPQKGHRLFSYYVIRSLLDGKTAIQDMNQYLHDHVRSVSAKMGADHLQEPFVAGRKAGCIEP